MSKAQIISCCNQNFIINQYKIEVAFSILLHINLRHHFRNINFLINKNIWRTIEIKKSRIIYQAAKYFLFPKVQIVRLRVNDSEQMWFLVFAVRMPALITMPLSLIFQLLYFVVSSFWLPHLQSQYFIVFCLSFHGKFERK